MACTSAAEDDTQREVVENGWIMQQDPEHIYNDSVGSETTRRFQNQAFPSFGNTTNKTVDVHPGERRCRLHIWNIFTAPKS